MLNPDQRVSPGTILATATVLGRPADPVSRSICNIHVSENAWLFFPPALLLRTNCKEKRRS